MLAITIHAACAAAAKDETQLALLCCAGPVRALMRA